MARLARTVDWRATSLGPAEAWPESLKTMAGMVIANGFPMLLLWGSELVQIYNDRYRDLMGKKHPAGMGQATRECWPEIWYINEPIYARVCDGETVTFENRLFRIKRYGYFEDAYFTLCYSPVRGAHQAVAGVLVTMFETTRQLQADTERRKVEAQLRESEERLQVVIDNVPGLVSCVDPETRYQYANRQYMNRFGVDVLNRTMEEVIGEETFARARPYLDQALAGKAVRFEVSHLQETPPRHLQIAFTPEIDAQGKVREVVIMVQDVSAQRRMEDALRASEQRLQQVLAQAPVGVAVLRGRELRVELANPSFQEFFPGRDLTGRPLREAVPEMRDETERTFRHVLDTGQPVVLREYLSRVDRDWDGMLEDSWFTTAVQPLRELDGTVSGIIVVVVDVTAHVRARQELTRANRELEEFAYVASHDIQEPLRTVSIYTQLLIDHCRAQDREGQTYARFIEQGVERMEQLIHDLLSYSSAVLTKEPDHGVADLRVALNAAMDILKTQIEESGAVITAGELPMVRGETSQLAHVFQNLLSNALKYRHPDRHPEIFISAEKTNGEWTIAVRDNGTGFDQKYARHIFGLFKRLHKGDVPGTGLGLAICQRIVERYGGRMWATGEPQKGAAFFITLPERA